MENNKKIKNVNLMIITKVFNDNMITNETNQKGFCDIDFDGIDYRIKNANINDRCYSLMDYYYDQYSNIIQTSTHTHDGDTIKEFSEKRKYDYNNRLIKISTSDGYVETREYNDIINGTVEITKNNSGLEYTVIKYNSKDPSIDTTNVSFNSSDNNSEDITKEIYNTENKLIFRMNSDGSSEKYNYNKDGQLISMYKDNDVLYIYKNYKDDLLIESVYDVNNIDGLYEKNIYRYNDSGELIYKLTMKKSSIDEIITIYKNTTSGCKIISGPVIKNSEDGEPVKMIPLFIKYIETEDNKSGHITREHFIQLQDTIAISLKDNDIIFNENEEYKFLSMKYNACIINNIHM